MINWMHIKDRESGYTELNNKWNGFTAIAR